MFAAKLIFILVVLGVVGYVALLRPILKQRAEFKWFYDAVSPYEDGLWQRIRLRLKGLKTLLFSRLLVIAGVLPSVLDQLGLVDWTQFASMLPNLSLGPLTIPPSNYIPWILAGVGMISEYLRSISNTPAGSPVPVAPPDTPVVIAPDTPVIVDAEAAASKGAGADPVQTPPTPPPGG